MTGKTSGSSPAAPSSRAARIHVARVTRRRALSAGGAALFGPRLMQLGAFGATQERSEVPNWVIFPEEDWVKITPTQAGFDVEKYRKIVANAHPRGASFGGEVHDRNKWGAVLTRGGYLVQIWGNPEYKYQSASLGKAFTWAAVGLAVDERLIKPDEPVRHTWTGERQLSHPHKYLNSGHHRTLSWRHLLNHQGGFPVTNGYYWRKGAAAGISPLPKWANSTGEPFYDNYSHAKPGTERSYSSGGYWRLAQALTVLWDKDLKQLLDEKLFRHMGIPANRWDWTPGKVVHDSTDWYPAMPGYGDFIDPPYENGGHVVRGGPGWVVMSPKDLARFGLLVATGGIWQGRRLISTEWIRGHAGGNASLVAGDRNTFISVGIVTTRGLPSIASFNEVVEGPVTIQT